MFKKKDIDVASIMRESFLEAKKEHGLLKEQEEKKRFVKRPFDKERDIPKIELKAAEWKDPKKPSSVALDVVLKGLIKKGSTPLETYKLSIENISNVLGMKVSPEGLPIKIEEKFDLGSDVKSILSALQVKDVMHSIIFFHDAQAAGKMFEGLVARMLGGTAKFDEVNPIQDIEADGQYISLKLISGIDRDVKGSKYNLAKGINKAEKVIYLVLVKSSEDNPFNIRAYSYEVNKNNYFSFILGRNQSELSEKVILQEMLKIIKLEPILQSGKITQNDIDRIVSEKDTPLIRKTYQPEYPSLGVLDANEINNAVIRYAKENNSNFSQEINNLKASLEASKKLKPGQETKEISIEDLQKQYSRDQLKKQISNALQQISLSFSTEENVNKEDLLAVQKYIENHFPMLDPKSEDYVFNMFPLSNTGAKSFMTRFPETFMSELSKLQNIPVLRRYSLFEPNARYKEILNKRADYFESGGKEDEEQENLTTQDNAVLNIILDDEYKKSYDRRYKFLYEKVQSLASIFNKIREYASEGSSFESDKQSSKELARKTVPTVTQQHLIDVFFETVAKDTGDAYKLTGKGSNTQFKIPAATMFEVAKKVNANYDENYPIFYIQKEWIMMSSKRNVELLDKILVPFFEGVHDIRSGLEQYFTYDEVEGLSETRKGLENTTQTLTKHEQTFKDTETGGVMKASQINPETYSATKNPKQQVAENVNKNLTKHWTEVMLEELLK